MNYEAAYLAKLEAIILSMDGTVPPMTTPTSFERRSLELLDAIATASAAAGAGAASSALLVGSSTLIPYPVTIANQLYTDPAGWLWYAPNGGSIGNAGSGSTVATAKLEQLFYRLWEHLLLVTPDWGLQTSAGGGSVPGATAAADWAAGKRLIVPDQRGRSPIAAGQGAGLSDRPVGWRGGAETHALDPSENAAHVHGVSDPGHNHMKAAQFGNAGGSSYDSGLWPLFVSVAGGSPSYTSAAASGIGIQNQGSGTPHNNMQPYAVYSLLWFTGQKA